MKDLQKYTFLLILIVSIGNQGFAQFTVSEDFRGGGSPEIIIGDNAYLTSGTEDPVNAGWLRLTEDSGNQKGYAFINKSFPSTLGVLVDFEYKMWRFNESDVGADGIGVFLFDGNYDENSFALGGYGGSLGYAPNGGSGLTGGYIGIGLDSYGNFSNPTEGRNGGPGERANSIVLRGPTTSDPSTTNQYLTGVQFGSGNKYQNELDYNEVLTARPDDNAFYRRVQIEINPTGTGFYDIIVRWSKIQGGPLVEVLNYTTNVAPPPLLKLGFAASTGGSYNNHEIRNLFVSTPGNLRILKKADTDILRSVSAGNAANEIEYTIDVDNDTDGPLYGIDFSDKLLDGNRDIVDPSLFSIQSITHSGFLAGTSLPTTSTDNEFSGTLDIAANSTGQIVVSGVLNGIPAGNVLTNTASVTANDIVDEDLGNNTSEVNTPVTAEGIDLVLQEVTKNPCLDSSGLNDFVITVSNVGANDLAYSGTNQIVVTKTLPAGVLINSMDYNGWSYTDLGNNIHQFTKTNSGTLGSGMSLPAISYTTDASSGFESTTKVELLSSAGTGVENTEPLENQGNNSDTSVVTEELQAPIVTSPIYYCLGETASSLTATPDSGNSLLWYLNPGGTASETAFVPSTSAPGSTIYYVSQTNGSCEGEMSTIEVIVMDESLPGSISENQEICNGTTPSLFTSVAAGSVPVGATISYKWQESKDDGLNWVEIPGATLKTYQADSITEETRFRRITVATQGTAVCESVPTNEILIQVKNCGVLTNPMLPSKTR